ALQDALKAILTKVVQKQTNERLDLVSDVLDDIQLYKAGISGVVYCTYAVRPTSLQIPATGGTVSATVDTDASCPWNVFDLPAWAHASGSGPGPGAVTITADPNPTVTPRSVIVTV